ncbi:MAG: hypothetical protein ACQEW7_12480 [Pseudomonadota bacterium]
MKGFSFLFLTIALIGTAQADPLTETITGASQAFGEHIVENMWRNRCSRAEAVRLHANCYVNPDGVALWQMKGAERERWKPTAVKESVRLQKEHQREMEIAKEQGQRAAKQNSMNHQMCEFWKQQKATARRNSKVSEYCQ